MTTMFKQRRYLAMALSALLGIGVNSVAAQETNQTTGHCSPIIKNNSGTISIECSGVPEDVVAHMAEILEKVARNSWTRRLSLRS
jgi:hypothetical protein